MRRWFDALARTRQVIGGVLSRLVTGPRPDAQTLEELEATLIRADVPARMAAELVAEAARTGAASSVVERLEQALLALLGDEEAFDWRAVGPRPAVILLVGVNGSGKTTTAAKLAAMAGASGLRPLLAAADTYRAAGSDQLRIWADRIGCECVGGVQGADSAAVAFDALKAAAARGCDVVVVDTAGRMHTRQPLMAELQKVYRTLGKSMPGAPHEAWIVLDASLGNNAVLQAKSFREAVPLTGVVVSKLDGSSKAGFMLALVRELGLPIRYVGLGEGVGDLVPFDRGEFARGLVGIGGAS